MNQNKRIKAFTELGTELLNYSEPSGSETDSLEKVILTAHHYNGWFTEENVRNAIQAWAEKLTEENLQKWLNKYEIPENVPALNVGIVMAGNIPLVGFHDLISVLLTGNTAIIKLSSDDDKLLPEILEKLYEIEPHFRQQIIIAEGTLQNFDAIIATGSNNTSRYFEYYFGKYPHMIRKNRNSVAVLSGNETHEELTQLGKDVFRYFGLGCRNVSKLYVPKGYVFDEFFESLSVFSDIIHHNKYGNNYDYNKAIYLVNGDAHLDSGFLLLKEDKTLASPVAALHYEFYDEIESLQENLQTKTNEIQCLVGNGENAISFGKTQEPELWDYADGLDTTQFLLEQEKTKA